MNKAEWNEGLNHLDSDLVETYIAQKDTYRQKRKTPGRMWLRVGAVAACLLLIVSAALVVPALQDRPIKLTGKQEIVYGEPWPGDYFEGSILTPGFYISTIVQANVIEVLPDCYYEPSANYRHHVARLSIVDTIHGEGFPKEIWLQFPYYDTDIFDGYETFIFSLIQIGVENYMLINDETREIAYFPNMFAVCIGDLGYGSAIAFNDDKVDVSFFDKADYYMHMPSFKEFLLDALQDPVSNFYPVGYDTTLEEAKANVKRLAQDSNNRYNQIVLFRKSYITTDDIFISEEQKQLQSSLAPSKTSVFLQTIIRQDDLVLATYARVVNGFLTDEEIVFNGLKVPGSGNYKNGNVYRNRNGVIYTEEDLKNMPDLGGILAEMDLSELQPPHIEVVDEMEFVSSTATGIYRKVEDQVYGIIRVRWYYNHIRPDKTKKAVTDECFYLCDQQGNCSIAERSQLEKLFDDRGFDDLFPFSLGTNWK